jgi:hypothetical protein
VSSRSTSERAFYEAFGAELLVGQPFQWDRMDLMAGYGRRDLDALTIVDCFGANSSGQ